MQEKLLACGQKKILNNLDSLTVQDKSFLKNQIDALDFSSLKKQQENFSQKFSLPFSPNILLSSSPATLEEQKLAESYLHKKGIALAILAGGQGTRLGENTLSKGCIEVSLIRKKSLFQLFSEKVVAVREKYGSPFYLTIMLSPINQDSIIQFFQKNHYFGLGEENVFFFEKTRNLQVKSNTIRRKKSKIDLYYTPKERLILRSACDDYERGRITFKDLMRIQESL